jgi:hypothetical protein
MANGPFGNPLSTGIALSFEVDMTPYRQMHARKMANIEEKKKERKKQQDELQGILKNITVDTSKVHERYKDDAMNEYAATINDVMSSFKSGDVAGTYQRINKFNNQINSYVNATQNFSDYVKSKGDNTFRNEELIAAMNNVEGVSDDQLMEMYQNDIDYSNGLFNFTVIDRPDLIGHANKVLQGVEKQLSTDDEGKYIRTGKFGPKGAELYQTSIPNVEQFITEESNWLKSSAGGNRLLMEYGGITPAQLDERDASGRQLRDVLAEDYVRKTLSNKLYGEAKEYPYKPESKTGGEKTFEEKYKVDKEPTFVDIEVDQNSGIPANSKLIGIPFNAQHDINATKWDYRKTIEISDGSYQMVGGRPIEKPSSRGPGVKETGAVPMGLYALKGPSDKRVYAGYLFKRRVENGPEVNVMHYQPLDANSLDQQYVREFIDASGISVDDYIEYYDIVAKKAGFPVSSYGGTSTSGTSSSGGDDEEDFTQYIRQ